MSEPKAIHLKDYTPPEHYVDQAELRFELDAAETRVHAKLTLRARVPGRPVRLDGEKLELLAIAVDGRPLRADEYSVGESALVIHEVPDRCVLETTARIRPDANTALEGLYASSGNLVTQCEAEGFRKITWFVDRPDNMATYRVRLEAERARYPRLLANGNRVAAGDLPEGRHFAEWHDPFPKPSYLFALVAGDLACVEDRFTTCSGREVTLQIYVQHGNEDKADHALAALKKAMRWDEERYGREYDLEIYMVVAVDDFNMGAMENKGLNVFNSRYVLAKPDTATDSDYVAIEGVIAHEYFHNWSGNRVTCRDWFQLSLKEGFTVFRDQQFTEDMTSGPVARIGEVGVLRSHQFREDAGPMAHPVRPPSYVEINNFYTLTVYNKGAEVVRMLRTLLGDASFRKGTDLYFTRHDGQAVTTDDFVRAMEEANGVDLTQFRRWYEQAGTPQITARGEYDAAQRRYTLHLSQHTGPTPSQPEKLPFHIPVAVGLLGRDGQDLPLRFEGEPQFTAGTRVLELTEAAQSFIFTEVKEPPVPSLLRGFSAPVKLDFPYRDDELAFLLAHDSDPFNRWEAGQRLALGVVLRNIAAHQAGAPLQLDAALADAFVQTLRNQTLDKSLIAQALTLPDEDYVAGQMAVVDPEAIYEARSFLKRALAQQHGDALRAVHDANAETGPYTMDMPSVGRRRLRNLALAYLMEQPDAATRRLCVAQLEQGGNMTDVMAALTALAHTACEERDTALVNFYRRWRHDPLVLDKWFALQATSPLPDTLAHVKTLTSHPDFNLRNPNRVRSLIGAFTQRNAVRFHDRSGEGYRFLADYVLELDRLNPQIAARLMAPLVPWRRYDTHRQTLMQAEIRRVLETSHLSRDVYEVVSKSLA